MNNELVEQGIAALKAGDKALARQLLKRAIIQGVNDEQAWLAMSEAAEDVEHAADCLRRVLTINPGNQRARSRLDQLAASAPAWTDRGPASQPQVAETSTSVTGKPAPGRQVAVGQHRQASRQTRDPEEPREAAEIPSRAEGRQGRGTGKLPGEALRAMWSQQRGNRKATPGAAASRARLFGQTPPAVPDAGTAQEALRCEKCGRPLGPAVLDCPNRPRGTCPYQVEHPSVRQRGPYWTLLALGSGVALLGLLLTGSVLASAMDGDRPPLCLVSACAMPLGLLAVLFGGLALFGEQLTLTNTATGQMWQRHRIGGFTTYQATASALQPVAFASHLRRPMHIPASICALCQSQDGTHVLYIALLSLLSQGFVALQCTTTSRAYLGMRVPLLSGRSFVLVPGSRPSPAQAAGELEKRIVHAVREWSQRADELIRFRGSFRRRAFRHFLALEDLVFAVFEGEHPGPDHWLAYDVVGADAVQRGLGHMVGPLKARFELLPECRESVLAEYDAILEVHNQFKASQPDIASELWANIKKHIEHLEPADSS